MHFYKPFLIALLLMLSAGKLSATHYFGADLFYTHIAGNTYRVTMVAFGDCSGAQFPSFPTTRPRIYIKQGNTEYLNGYLDQEAPKEGIEVTNGCAADLKRTTCADPPGTIPGVKKFIYSKEFTLPYAAPDWKFVSLGETDANTIAGRSNSMTNISPVGVICLEATLDNTQYSNSSPQLSTIATQFYCINSPTAYMPGATDADGDSLVYELVPGLNPTGQVIYNAGFSGSNPLAVAPGAFSFDNGTGQLSFTPNILQKALVVYRISEYRNGILLGSIMREMTIVVLPCSNNPPRGYISNVTGADVIDSVTVETCIGNHEVTFDINPTDADKQNIKMVATDLQTGATLDITNNNTDGPQSRFVWNMPDLPEGDYKFNITYTDDGCPPSQQQQTYTVRIKYDKIFAQTVAAGCITQGLFKVITPDGWSPWQCKIYDDIKPVYNMQSIATDTWSDSIAVGKYKVYAVNYFGCTAETEIEIPNNCYLADIPTAFSPNGDGHNDILLVRGINIQELHLRIYNRWGQLVFETQNVNTGWDGKFNGQDAPTESYAFVLSLSFKNGEVFQKMGNITLLR